MKLRWNLTGLRAWFGRRLVFYRGYRNIGAPFWEAILFALLMARFPKVALISPDHWYERWKKKHPTAEEPTT